jgi:hypothetical protein
VVLACNLDVIRMELLRRLDEQAVCDHDYYMM